MSLWSPALHGQCQCYNCTHVRCYNRTRVQRYNRTQTVNMSHGVCVPGRGSQRPGPASGHLDPAGNNKPNNDLDEFLVTVGQLILLDCLILCGRGLKCCSVMGPCVSVHAPDDGGRVRAPSRTDGSYRRQRKRPHLPHSR